MPLRRRISGPKAWVICSIQGKKRFGSSSPARSEMLPMPEFGYVVMIVIMIMVMVVMMVMVIVVVVVAFKEAGVEREDAVEVEGAAIEDLVEGDVAAFGAVDDGMRVDPPDPPLERGEVVGRNQVGLVEENDVGEAELFLGLRRVEEAKREVFGVGDRHHRVELGLGADVVVHEERLRHRSRIGKAGGLDQDAVEPARPLHQALDDADQVAANGAADAAVVHLVDLFVGLDDQVVVDADLPELVDHDRVALAVVLAEDTVEERRLAGAEIAGEHRDGDLGFGHRGTPGDGRSGLLGRPHIGQGRPRRHAAWRRSTSLRRTGGG